MGEFQYNNFVRNGLQNSVAVTGIPRSGTSILGQLIGSFSNVEYAYEPPMTNFFDAHRRHDNLSEETVTEMVLPYLFFEHFTNYLHGRRYSFREEDFSYILGMKSVPEVIDNWSRVKGIQDAVEMAPESTFVFKYPGFYNLLSTLANQLSTLKVIDIGRNLDRVLVSLYAKEWFTDKNLQPGSAGRWPYLSTDEILVPYVVDPNDVTDFKEMSAANRTVYVCNRWAEDRLAFQERYGDNDMYLTIRYERLIEDPKAVADDLATFVDVSHGPKTSEVVDIIEPTSAPADINNVLEQCDEKLRTRFAELRSKM